MKWYDTKKDKLPKDGETVLISVKGVNYVAAFKSGRKVFKVEGELKKTAFKANEDSIYWTEFKKPPSYK